MVEWKELGQLGKFENIGTDKKINEGERIVTLLNYVDVYHHKYIDSSIPQMQVSASDRKIEDCTVEEGDIFVTPSSETVDDIGHSSVVIETIPNSVYSYHIMRYRLFQKNMILSYYINYAFDTENVKRQILKKAQGLTRFGLSKDKFASIQIPIPSLFEQTRIVGILDTFTASIENLKEQITERRKQYEYYRDQLLDLEGIDGAARIVLKDVCEVINGRAYSQPELLSEGKYRVLRVGNFFSNDSWYYSDLELEDKYYCKNGDLLYAWSASFGPHIWNEEKVIYHYHIWKIGCDERILKKYMYYWLQSEDMKKQAFTNLHGATMAHLTKVLMESLMVPIPSLSEQSRIVSILDTFEASISNLEAQLKEREKQYEYYRNKLLAYE